MNKLEKLNNIAMYHQYLIDKTSFDLTTLENIMIELLTDVIKERDEITVSTERLQKYLDIITKK